MRIVADTNVIVSALVFGGVPRQVLELAETARCELFYSEAIRGEVRRVVAEKFGWDSAALLNVLPVLWNVGEMVVPRTTVRAIPDDPDDDRILECALAAKATFIVSGDRHLLRLGRYKSIVIVSPRQFIEVYLEESVRYTHRKGTHVSQSRRDAGHPGNGEPTGLTSFPISWSISLWPNDLSFRPKLCPCRCRQCSAAGE